MGPISYCLYVIAVLSTWNTAVHGQTEDIDMEAKHLCSDAGNGQIRFHINMHDKNRQAIAVRALNATNEEINTCTITESTVTGSDGITNRTFTVTSIVTIATGTENNACDMRVDVINGNTYYTWHFRARASANTAGIVRRGFIVNATCDRNLTDGLVTTQARFNISQMFVTARLASGVTGVNTFANNSELTLTAVVYPEGLDTQSELQNAKGIYLRNCFAGTNEAISENRQRIVDVNGCPVSGALYAPSSGPRKRVNTGFSPITIDASFIRAAKIGDESMVYIQCQVVKCTIENDQWCDNPCNAFNNKVQPSSSTVTTVVLNTNFGIQDIPVQQFFVTAVNQNSPINTVTVNANPNIQIQAIFAPNGVGSVSNSAIRTARGFYLYSCQYANNVNFNNPTTFVNNAGCFVPGTMLSGSGEFLLDSANNFVYVIKSGQVTLQSSASYERLWARCFIGVCQVDGHERCSRRCGATRTDQFQDLTSQVQFTFTMLNTTSQSAVTVQVSNSDGSTLSGTTQAATVGQQLNFGVTVIPGGTGQASNQFGTAKGIYVHNCYVSSTQNPTEAQKTYIIDNNGCRIPGPNSPSENCRLNEDFPGQPPFTVSCGTVTAQTAGPLYHNCQLGECTTVSNPACVDRCSVGNITLATNAVDLPFTFSSQTQVVEVNNERTAVRANEVRNIVLAVTVAIPVVSISAVAVITYCIVAAQRPKL